MPTPRKPAQPEESKPIANRPGPAEIDREYFIVNPAGAVHGVTREHAKERLRQIGYRMATPAEIAKYQEQDIQDYRYPIAPRWAPDPDAQLEAIDRMLKSQ